jgi:D-alanine-D-alanine ligase
MKKQRVLVLMHESLVPPANPEHHSKAARDEWQTESDLMKVLTAAGHEVRPLGLYDNLTDLRTVVAEWQPHVAFNLLEEFQGIVTYDQYIVAYLELLRQPYTGCNPRGMMLSRDKVLSKQLLSYHRIPTPRFALVRQGRPFRLPRKLKYPLFVKSAVEDASLGIAQASIVEDAAHLKDRIEFIHDKLKTDALVEEYIQGREVYVGVFGNTRLTTLPIWEMDFGTLPDAQSGIATRKVKWDRKYQEKHGIRTGPAQNLPNGVAERLATLSKRIYRSLHLSGYARMDFRLASDGTPYVLEANCNPNLSQDEDFAAAAAAAKIPYESLLERMMSLGLGYEAEWRTSES